MQFRDYQKQIIEKASAKIKENHIAYLVMEMRTGKTLTALGVAEKLNKKSVLFITKIKAMPSVSADYKLLDPTFELKIIGDSYQAIEKEITCRRNYDLIIVDEAHGYGKFPRPSMRTRKLKMVVEYTDLILLSGTPTPETDGVQFFHQFALSKFTPFEEKNFYRWADNYVIPASRYYNGILVQDYSNGDREKIMSVLRPYILTCTQEEAGFSEEIGEQIHIIKSDAGVKALIRCLRHDKFFRFHKCDETISCDTALKEMQKIHQLSSGTILTDSGKRLILSTSKADYIKRNFVGRKIAIFYKFIAEGDVLREAFPNFTDSPEVFDADETGKVFICQIRTGSMGISLRSADDLIFYNIDFSAVQYYQARARLSDKTRTKPIKLHWLFSSAGIERKVYKAIKKKQDYTTEIYRKEKL